MPDQNASLAEREAALDRFKRAFHIIDTSLFHMPRDRSGSDDPRGDCQDFAKTVKRILGVKFPRAVVIRCWSKPGLPRHAVLWVKGRGCIDSTTRHFRKTPWPCVPAWPVGAPAIVGLAVAAKLWGMW